MEWDGNNNNNNNNNNNSNNASPEEEEPSPRGSSGSFSALQTAKIRYSVLDEVAEAVVPPTSSSGGDDGGGPVTSSTSTISALKRAKIRYSVRDEVAEAVVPPEVVHPKADDDVVGRQEDGVLPAVALEALRYSSPTLAAKGKKHQEEMMPQQLQQHKLKAAKGNGDGKTAAPVKVKVNALRATGNVIDDDDEEQQNNRNTNEYNSAAGAGESSASLPPGAFRIGRVEDGDAATSEKDEESSPFIATSAHLVVEDDDPAFEAMQRRLSFQEKQLANQERQLKTLMDQPTEMQVMATVAQEVTAVQLQQDKAGEMVERRRMLIPGLVCVAVICIVIGILFGTDIIGRSGSGPSSIATAEHCEHPFSLVDTASNKTLTVADCRIGANVFLDDARPDDMMQAFRMCGGSIFSEGCELQGNAKVLDVAYGSCVSESNVQVYDPNGSGAQKFAMKRDGGIEYANPICQESMFLGWDDIDFNIKLVPDSVSLAIIAPLSALTTDLCEYPFLLVDTASDKTLTVADCSIGANVYLDDARAGDMMQAFRNCGDTISSEGCELVGNPKVLDVAYASCESEANVQVFHPNGAGAQKFVMNTDGGIEYTNPSCKESMFLGWDNIDFNIKLVPDSMSLARVAPAPSDSIPTMEHCEHPFLLVDTASNKTLTVAGCSIGANVYLDDTREGDMMQVFRNCGDTISSEGCKLEDNPKVLDVTYASCKSGANVQVFDPNGKGAQKFTINTDGGIEYGNPACTESMFLGWNDTDFNIELVSDSVSLAIVASPSASGPTPPSASGPTTDPCGGPFSLVDTASNKTLTVAGCSLGANVYLDDARAGDMMQAFRMCGDAILSEGCELEQALDIAWGSCESGANVQVFSTNGSGAQKFAINEDGTIESINPSCEERMFFGFDDTDYSSKLVSNSEAPSVFEINGI